jgi:hypothetical protein
MLIGFGPPQMRTIGAEIGRPKYRAKAGGLQPLLGLKKDITKEKLTCPPKTDPHVKLEGWIEGRQGDEQEAAYSGADHCDAFILLWR